MKKMFLSVLLAWVTFTSFAQVREYMTITTIESVIPAGLGRSRMLVTGPDGKTTEADLLNFFSMVGINFKNIASNDQAVVQILNRYAQEGWEVVNSAPGVYGPGDSQGLFITRYILRRNR